MFQDVAPPGAKSVAGGAFVSNGELNPQHQIESNVCAKLRRNAPQAIPEVIHSGRARRMSSGSSCVGSPIHAKRGRRTARTQLYE
jgi:hypothetical protein